MLKKIKKDKKGFTLIELIVVIVILAILAVVGLTAMNGFIGRANRTRVLSDARATFLAGMAVGADLVAANGGGSLDAADITAFGTAQPGNLEAILGDDFLDGVTLTIAIDSGGNVTNTFSYAETVGGTTYTITRPDLDEGFVIAET